MVRSRSRRLCETGDLAAAAGLGISKPRRWGNLSNPTTALQKKKKCGDEPTTKLVLVLINGKLSQLADRSAAKPSVPAFRRAYWRVETPPHG